MLERCELTPAYWGTAVMVVVGNMKFMFRMHRMLQRSGKKHKLVFKLPMNIYTAVAGGFA